MLGLECRMNARYNDEGISTAATCIEEQQLQSHFIHCSCESRTHEEGSFKSGLAPILVHLEGADGVVVLGSEAPSTDLSVPYSSTSS